MTNRSGFESLIIYLICIKFKETIKSITKVLFYESQYLIPFMGVVFGTGWSFIEFMKDYFFSIKSA